MPSDTPALENALKFPERSDERSDTPVLIHFETPVQVWVLGIAASLAGTVRVRQAAAEEDAKAAAEAAQPVLEMVHT